jgi:hypothetical protein
MEYSRTSSLLRLFARTAGHLYCVGCATELGPRVREDDVHMDAVRAAVEVVSLTPREQTQRHPRESGDPISP